MDDESGAETRSPPRKKHQLQPKIDTVFAKWSSLRKEADEDHQADGAGQGLDDQTAGGAVPASVTVEGKKYTTVGPVSTSPRIRRIAREQRARDAEAARKIVNPAMRAEVRRLGRVKSTTEYAMLSVGGSLPQPQPHPTDIDPADHLASRDPQLPASLFHARRAGSMTGTYNKFSNEEKAIVILRWLDYRIKHSKPIPIVIAALKAEDTGSRWRGLDARTIGGWITHYEKYIALGEKEVALFQKEAPQHKAGPKTILHPSLDTELAGIVRSFLNAHPDGLSIKWIAAYVRGVMKDDPRFSRYLQEPGRVGARSFQASDEWVIKRMREWGLSHRKGTTAARKLPPDVDEQHELYILRTSYLVHTLAKDRTDAQVIPPALVANFDQGALPLFSTSKFTWAEKGVKEVPVLGLDDKRCITGVLGSKADGTLLPLQVVMTGKTERCLPSKSAREAAEAAGFHYTYTDNHWSNLTTTKQYVEKIIEPDFARTREALGLDPDFPSLLHQDCWKVHISRAYREMMKEEHPTTHLQYVPALCTGRMQPQDLAGQREMKTALIDVGTGYVGRAVERAMQEQKALRHAEIDRRAKDGWEECKGDDDSLPPIVPPNLRLNLNLGALKPLLPSWHLYAWKRLERDGTAMKGWQKSRLLEAWRPEKVVKAMQLHAEGKLFPQEGEAPEEPDMDEHGHEIVQPESAMEDERARGVQGALWAEITQKVHKLRKLAEDGEDVGEKLAQMEAHQRELDPDHMLLTQDKLEAIMAEFGLTLEALTPPSITNHGSTQIPMELLELPPDIAAASARAPQHSGATRGGRGRRGGRGGRGGGGRGRGGGTSRVTKSAVAPADKELVGRVWVSAQPSAFVRRYQVVKVQYQRKTKDDRGGYFVGYYVALPCRALRAQKSERSRSAWINKHGHRASVGRIREMMAEAKSVRAHSLGTALQSDSEEDDDDSDALPLSILLEEDDHGHGEDRMEVMRAEDDKGSEASDEEEDGEEEYEGESEVDEEADRDAAAFFKAGESGACDGGADAGAMVVTAPTMEEVGWVQCESCSKWRSGPPELTTKLANEATPWMCEQNTWDAARATCDAPEEAY